LKELYLMSSDRNTYFNQDECLHASDVTSGKWVCTSLEVFGCKMNYIPRPDIRMVFKGLDMSWYLVEGSCQRSLELQQNVYSQLSRLTRLRELTLGLHQWQHPNFSLARNFAWRRQYDCLERVELPVKVGLEDRMTRFYFL
ncbi:hypothetical protein BGX23_002033, partial [Mortierella sp. AD031]